MTKHWWQRRSGRIVAEFDVLCVCVIITILTVPALAATDIPVPFTNTVINVGDVPPWIAAIVLAVTWWEARSARKELKAQRAETAAIGVKIDGMLVDRDKAKVAEGEERGKQAGADAAVLLAEGQRQGRESEREKATAQSTVATEGNRPLPVADERTAVASERVAKATERAAAATSRVADASEKKK